MGRKIGAREFRKTYGIHLLPVSTENMHPGDRVDFGLIVNNGRFTVKGESIVRELGLDRAKENALEKKLEAVDYSDAGFAQLEMTRGFLVDADLNIPSIGVNLQGKVDVDKVVKMSFDDVTVREISDGDLRDTIEDYIEDVQDKKGKDWRKLKRKGIALKFFYAGAVSLEIEEKIEFDLGVEFEVQEISAEVGAEGEDSTKYKYSFGSSNCPFAVYFESVKEFIE